MLFRYDAPFAEPSPLHIEEHGRPSAEPSRSVVFAHGFGGSARNFRPQERALRKNYHVVLFDTRGHARSAAPQGEQAYTWGALTEDLARVVQRTRDGRAVVGGLSLGAVTALLHALRRPETVEKLVLAALPREASASAFPDHVRSNREWALEFAACIDDQGLEAAGERFVWGRGSRFDPGGAALIRRGFLEHSPGALAMMLRSALAHVPSLEELLPELAELRMPTLIIVGEHDAACRESSERATELIPGARLAVIGGAGHVVNLGNIDAFNAELLAFLDS